MSASDLNAGSGRTRRRFKRQDPAEAGDPFLFPVNRFSQRLASGAKVYISHLWNASTMTVFAKKDEGKIHAMHNKIIDMFFQNRLHIYGHQPKVGDIVLTPYGRNERIFRGIIEETFENDHVTVLFIDLGDKIRVHYDQCYMIPAEILFQPIYGLMIELPGVPNEATSMLSTKSKDRLVAHYETGTIKIDSGFPMMISVAKPLEVEKYLISEREPRKKEQKMVEWRDLIRSAIVCSGDQIPMNQFWNPWSTKAWEVLSKACDGSQKKIEAMVESSLIEWSREFYKRCLESIKKYQINELITYSEKLLYSDSFDEADWSDTIKGFHYSQKDVPVSLIPPGEQITIRVRHFASPTDWTGTIVSEPFLTYRRKLCKILDEHCEETMTKKAKGEYTRAFLPEKGEFCFIYLHTWRDMDRMMLDDKRGDWEPNRGRRSPMDDQEAGHWYRAISSGTTNPGVYCRYWKFYVLDLGRFVVAPEEHILPGLLKYLLIPKLAIRGSFPVPCIGLKENINKSWYDKMNKGLELDLRIVEPEVNLKTIVEIVMNDKSKKLHGMIQPKVPKQDLAEALQGMAIRQVLPYRNMLSADDRYDDDDDDY